MLVLMLVEFRKQKCLCFPHSHVRSDPSFIFGMDDTRAVDTEASEPFLDAGYCFLFRGKHVVNLRSCPMLAILLRVGVRPILVDC
jgi:hypothetical protein